MRFVALLLAFSSIISAGERDAAEWVIRQGGRVTINGERRPLAQLAELPAGELQLTGIDLMGTTIDPKELVRFSGLTGLKEIFLPGASWTPGAGSKLDENASLRHLAGLKTLERLEFSMHFLPYFNVTDAGFEQIASLTQLKELRCTQCRVAKMGLAPFVNLESLDLSYAAFGDAGMASLEGMHGLRRLYLRDTLVTDDGLRHIAGLTGLEELDLYGTKVTDEGVAYLKGLTKLRKLILLGAPVTDASAAVFAGMPRLHELNLYRSHVTNTGLGLLAGLKELSTMDLRYSRVTATGVAAFRAAVPGCEVEFAGIGGESAGKKVSGPAGTSEKAVAEWVSSLGGKVTMAGGHVQTVSLAATHVSDAQMGFLAPLTAIEKLDLSATEIGDQALVQVSKLGSLRELILNATTVADAGIAHLSGLRNLRVLRVRNTLVTGTSMTSLPLTELDAGGSPVSNAGLAAVVKMQGIERLSLADSEVTDTGLRELVKLPALRVLDLSAADVDDSGLPALAALTELRELKLNYARFGDKEFPALKTLTKLERLELVRTRAGKVSMTVIAEMRGLRTLNLDYTSVDDKSFVGLSGLRGMQQLSLDSANVGDEAVPAILGMKGLRTLNLYHTQVTQAGVDRIKAALPECKVLWERDATAPNRRRT